MQYRIRCVCKIRNFSEIKSSELDSGLFVLYNTVCMYIFELIAKKFCKKKEPEILAETVDTEGDYPEKCEHTFFPIDSTGETLACSKCGMLVKNSEQRVKPNNPFV